MELIKVIAGYPRYSVSNAGDVMNNLTGRILSPYAGGLNGWVYVKLCTEASKVTLPLNKLVANAFLDPPPPSISSLIHIDGNRGNCRSRNLAWASRGVAIMYMREILKEEYTQPWPIYTENTDDVFKSISHLASVLRIPPSVILRKITGSRTYRVPLYGALGSRNRILALSRKKRGL